jgi:putative oxidoreductase
MAFQMLFRTRPDVAPTVARVILGLIIFPHGLQHAAGLLGGGGFAATMQWMTGTLHIPASLAALAIAVEFAAPLFLLAGLAGRVASAGVIVLMLVALSTHTSNGFFMNWFGALPAGQEGYEYHLLAIGLAAVVATAGSGAWSLDLMLARTGAQDATPAARGY